MSILKNIFENLKQSGRKAFIPFITAGDGGLDNTEALIFSLAENGAEIIELGVPFSDPMADGPVIAKSHERAVADGVSLADVLDIVERFRGQNKETGIVLMGYTNPVEIYGYKAFAERAKEVGVDGVLMVDMPPEEAQDLKKELDDGSFDTQNVETDKLEDMYQSLLARAEVLNPHHGPSEILNVHRPLDTIKKNIDMTMLDAEHLKKSLNGVDK